MKLVLITLSPLFILIGIGMLLTWKRFIGVDMIRDLTKLVFWVGLPALIVDKLSEAEVAGGEVVRLTLVFFAASVAAVGLAIAGCRLLNLGRPDWGTFIQGAFRGNLAFVGLPILIYLLAGQGEERVSEVVALAMLSFAPIMILYNGVSILALEWSRQQPGADTVLNVFKELIKNPLILASLVGMGLRVSPLEVPGPLRSVLEMLGAICVPLALLCLGGALVTFQLRGRIRSSVVASVLKTAAVPLLSLLIMCVVPLSDDARMVCLIFSACPTAVASYVMAARMGGDEALASGIIFCSTLFSALPLSLVIYFLAH